MTDMNFLDVQPGDEVVLLNGGRAIVTDNPGDGLWLIGRYLDNGQASSQEKSIFAHYVKEIIPASGRAE